MQSTYINPFLSASIHVLETVIQIRPSVGGLRMGHLSANGDMVWLGIHVFGQMQGNIVFGFPRKVALLLVSAMMGGYTVTELDEMTRSAISELGNMISGNASTRLSEQGIQVDITTPKLFVDANSELGIHEKAFTVNIGIESIGDFDIYVFLQ